MGKNYMGFFYGKKYNSGNGTFSFETGENFIEGTGPYIWIFTEKNDTPKTFKGIE